MIVCCAILMNLLQCTETLRHQEVSPLSADGRIGRLVVWSGPLDSLVWDTYVVEIEDIARDKYRIIDTLGESLVEPIEIYYCDSVSVAYEALAHDDTARLVIRRFVSPKAVSMFALLPLLDSVGNWKYVRIVDVQPRDSLLLLSDSTGIRLAVVNEVGMLTDSKMLPEAQYPVFSDDGKQVVSWRYLPDWANCERWALNIYDILADSSYSWVESPSCHDAWVQRLSKESPVFYLDTPDSVNSLNLYYRMESVDTAVQVTHYRLPEWVSYYWLMEDSITLWINQYGKAANEQRIEVIPMPGE